ncbi:hypothetical protein CI41S_39670 [Bradyrhizobium ivorense]|nr:hypothetical protein CI41S_39670 [Bradyrhizobium ivorense]
MTYEKIPGAASAGEPAAPETSRRAATRPADFASRDALKRGNGLQSLLDAFAITFGVFFGFLLGVAVGAAVGIPVWLAFAGR